MPEMVGIDMESAASLLLNAGRDRTTSPAEVRCAMLDRMPAGRGGGGQLTGFGLAIRTRLGASSRGPW